MFKIIIIIDILIHCDINSTKAGFRYVFVLFRSHLALCKLIHQKPWFVFTFYFEGYISYITYSLMTTVNPILLGFHMHILFFYIFLNNSQVNSQLLERQSTNNPLHKCKIMLTGLNVIVFIKFTYKCM